MASDLSKTTAAEGELPLALAFVRDAFTRWRQQGWIRGEEQAALEAYYDGVQRDAASGKPLSALLTLPPADVCWSCKAPVGSQSCCADCGAPANNETVDRLRCLVCVCHEIKKHEREGRLELSAAHACLADANSHIAALRRKLNGQRVAGVLPSVLPVEPARAAVVPSSAAVEAPPAPIARRNFLEVLLDPRSIQWLLASGGAALVIGLLIWLAAEGLFGNSVFVAVLLGGANFAVLAAGLATVRFTRYHMAGRALTLLACLVMPLNLWFYDSQHLITIKENGHLWVAALVCVALYALSAAVLRDPMLVYVFVGGVAMTGLLLLADHAVADGALFWTASGPCTFLVGLGLACIYLIRVFPEGEGPFTRRKFGLAFFWSGHAVLAAGLLVLLAAQLTCGLFFDFFLPFYQQVNRWLGYDIVAHPSEIVATLWGQRLALVIVAAATAAYVYSDVVVRKVGVYVHVAVVVSLWAEILLLSLVHMQWPDLPIQETAIIVLALTGLAANFIATRWAPGNLGLWRTALVQALGLTIVPLLIGFAMHFRATVLWSPVGREPLTWWFVAAMAVLAGSCRASAHLYRAKRQWLTTLYLFCGAAALMLMASGVVMVWEPATPWIWVTPWLALIPLGLVVAARLYRGRSMETPFVWAAHGVIAVLIASCLGATVEGFVVLHGSPDNLALAWFFAEAALFYLLAALWRDREFAVYAGTMAAAAAVWQLLTYFDLYAEYYIGAFAVLGVALLVVYRFAVLEKKPIAGLGRAAFQSANALIVLAEAAGALLSLSSLASPPAQLGLLVAMQAVLVVAAVAALFLVRLAGWRRGYLVAAVGNAALAVLVLILQIDWTPWQKLEIVCLALGATLLIAAHLGWFREREREDDMVSFGLLLGSLLVGVPLTWAVLYCRFGGEEFNTFHTLNEVGMLAAGLVLLAAGFAMRVKSTTLTGAVMMALYVLSLVAFIRLPALMQTAAVYLMIGGGLFFLVGLLLAVYRDRLLALPQKIKRREGVFRVLNWR